MCRDVANQCHAGHIVPGLPHGSPADRDVVGRTRTRTGTRTDNSAGYETEIALRQTTCMNNNVQRTRGPVTIPRSIRPRPRMNTGCAQGGVQRGGRVDRAMGDMRHDPVPGNADVLEWLLADSWVTSQPCARLRDVFQPILSMKKSQQSQFDADSWGCTKHHPWIPPREDLPQTSFHFRAHARSTSQLRDRTSEDSTLAPHPAAGEEGSREHSSRAIPQPQAG